VKHVRPICRCNVVAADQTQEFICRTMEMLNALLQFFGGASPVGLWIESKCAIPTPNPSGGTGTTTTA
jgi:hypothetical protein